MSKKENRGKQFFAGKNFQIKGRIFFPHILTVKTNPKDPSKRSFTTMFAWKPEENPQVTQALLQLMQQAKQQFHPMVPELHWVNPIKHFDNPANARMDGKPHPEYLRGHHWLNANANERFAPKVIKRDPTSPTGIKQLTPFDEAEVYSGRNAVISVSFWLLDDTKLGVSVNLDGVLLEEGGEKVIGDAGIDPSQAFASFLGTMGAAPMPQQQQQYAQQPAYQAQPQQPAQPQYAQQPAHNPNQGYAPQPTQPTQPTQPAPGHVGGMPNMPWNNNGQGGYGGGGLV